MHNKRILYIVPHRMQRSPGQRFRCEQYIPHLQEAGYQITYSNLLSASDDVAFYSRGKYFYKLLILVKSFFVRLYDVFRAPRYDIVFVYREAIMVGSCFFERLLRLSGAKLVFDFDDSIWLNDTSDGNQNLAWMKRPQKTATIIKLSHLVITGNQYLANYAKQFSSTVVIVPTTIDMQYHRQQYTPPKTVCIGWTGTATTLKHFVEIVPVLERIKARYQENVCFKLINNVPYSHAGLQLEASRWNLDTEIDDLCGIDIGIMPLPNDQWANGKCGFKGLQYMSLGIATIMSPVGVNTQIISHGVNGFLADSAQDWFNYLCQLIEDVTLRQRIGAAGKETVAQNYSVQVYKQKYVQMFDNLLN